MNARLYDAGAGIFTSVDPVFADMYRTGGLNAYGYVYGNPFSFVDPDGKEGRLNLQQYEDFNNLRANIERVFEEGLNIKYRERSLASYLPGTEAGKRAAEYWSDVAVNSDHAPAPLAHVPGALSTLWTEETAVQTMVTLGTAGTGGALAAGSVQLNGMLARGMVAQPQVLRFLPQSAVRSTLDIAGWSFKGVRPSTAARGGWARTYGKGPDSVLQWSNKGGRHKIAYWKLTGSTVHGTHKVAYFRFGKVPD